MNKKILLIGCALLLMLSLSACRLAQEDGLDGQGDRLIGVYITREYLDLFDFEMYLNDNAHRLVNGGEITVENQDKYTGRIYAALKSRTHVSETGDIRETWDYEFENLDGIPFFLAKITQPDGEVYTGSSSDSLINDAHITVGDNDSLEGTVYMTPDGPDVLYVNPVYQSGDGEVYLMTGTGMGSSGMKDEGMTFSTTLDETRTVTENGETTEESFSVKIQFAIKYPPVSVGIYQMNAENTPVSHEEYSPDALPQEIAVGPDTAYVIVETKALSPGGEKVIREIYQPGDDYFTTYAEREDGLCQGKTVTFLWKEDPQTLQF